MRQSDKKGAQRFNSLPICFLIAGITDQGLYRIVGVGSKVQNLLLQCIDKKKAKSVDLADEECEWEVKTITSALKQYLRLVYSSGLRCYQSDKQFIDACPLLKCLVVLGPTALIGDTDKIHCTMSLTINQSMFI